MARCATKMKYRIIRKALRYAQTRFIYILFIWASVAALISLFSYLLDLKIESGNVNYLDVNEIVKFADLKLIIVLLIGWGAFALIARALYENINVTAAREVIFRKAISGTMDEISSASTHFAWIKIIYFLLTANFSAATFHDAAKSLLFFVVAILTFDLTEKDGAEGANFVDLKSPSRLNDGSQPGQSESTLRVEEFDVRIIAPLSHAEVGEQVDVSGTIAKLPPDEYSLWIVRRWESQPNGYYPLKKVNFTPADNGGAIKWIADNCYVGGRPGKKDGRIFEAWLVGSAGSMMFSAWQVGNEQFWQLNKTAKIDNALYPPLYQTTADMKLCGRRFVVRK